MGSKLRIGLLTHQWPGARMGGVGSYTWHGARALANAGHEAHVFTLPLPTDVRAMVEGWKPTPFDARCEGGRLVLHEVDGVAERVAKGTLPGMAGAAVMGAGEGVYRLAVGKFLGDAAVAEGVQIIEAPEYEALGLPLLMKGDQEIPVITHIHSGSVIAHRAGMNVNRIVGRSAGLTEREVLFEELELFATLLANGRCAATRRVLEDSLAGWADGSGKLLIDETKIVRLPFIEESGRSTRNFTPPPRDGAILYVGRLERLKGAHLLPEAINRLIEACPDASVRVAGPDTATAPREGDSSPSDVKGDSMLAWVRQRLAPAAGERTTFLGEQSRTQLDGEFASCRFVILPSLADNYPYVCCEAMAAGRGVLLSSDIGATEVAGEAGTTFTRGDAAALGEGMIELWKDSAAVETLAHRAWERAAGELSVEKATATRISFYRKVIETWDPHFLKGRRDRLFRGRTTLDVVAGRVEAAVAAMEAALNGDVRAVSGMNGIPTTPGEHFVTAVRQIAECARLPDKPEWRKVYLFGAGRHTQRLMAEQVLWKHEKMRVVGIIDDHSRYAEGGEFLGLPVQSLASFEAEMAGGAPFFPVVVLSTDTFEQVFWERTEKLRTLGVPVVRLYS